MSLLGLELNDVGIMVAASDPARLLPIDGRDTESPGIALVEKKGLTIGKAAERKAHLYPNLVINRFWDQLNTEPLGQSNPYAQNHAELAYEHLARVWESVKHIGNEIVIAVPGFFNRDQMGLILGMARELSIPVTGFVVQGVVAAPNGLPDGLLLHLDMHLHRSEVTYLERNDRITHKDSLSAEGNGIVRLFREWADAIAEEFVRKTRFDPLHEAASEQELYNRLPVILEKLQQNSTVDLEMKGGSKTFHVTLTQDLFIQKSEPVFRQIGQLIDHMLRQHGNADSAIILQLTHRLARLPGAKAILTRDRDCLVVDLEPGTGALGTLQCWNSSPGPQGRRGAPFLTSRPLPASGQSPVPPPQPQETLRPTHLLYRDLAYPITAQPLFIGESHSADGPGLVIQNQNAVSSPNYCAIQVRGAHVVLDNLSPHGTFVDGDRVTENAVLQLGQAIRVGTPGETLRLIAFREIP
jgi:hypothetical protein